MFVPEKPCQLASFPHEGLAERIVGNRLADWEPSGYTRELYLDIAERVVRAAAAWQDAYGCIIDPYEGAESPTTTSRFIGAAAGLIGAGRCLDLIAPLVKSFDWTAQLLVAHQGSTPPLQSADFFTKELAWGFGHLQSRVSAEIKERWRRWLIACTPRGHLHGSGQGRSCRCT